MRNLRRPFGRAALTAAMATGLIATSVAAAPLMAGAATPGLRVSITNNGMYVDGPTTLPAGRVRLLVDASGSDRGVEIIRLAKGYSFPDFHNDVKATFKNLNSGHTKAGLAALHRAITNVTFYGGLYAPAGHTRRGVVLLPTPGNRYILFDDSGQLPRRPVHLTVTAAQGPQSLPAVQATVVAKSTRRWTGNTVLPAHGDIKFANQATNSPHFLVLEHVKDGTTRKQVIDSFSSPNPPDFVLPGEQDSDVVGVGHAMVLHLNLPPGRYAQMCFFPDPETGMPHAFMGMVRMVTVQ